MRLLRAITVAVGAFGAAAAKVRGPDHLSATLQQLRSQLSQQVVQPDDDLDMGLAPIARPVELHMSSQESLEGKLKEGLEREQRLMDQLHASEASAAWLAGQLHNATGQVQAAFQKQTQAENIASKDEALAKSTTADSSKEEAEVQKLKSHERWLGAVVKKMLKADKELQNRTNTLQEEARSLQSRNAELLAQNKDLEREKDTAEEVMAEQRRTNVRDAERLKEDRTEKEALQVFLGKKEADMQEQEAEVRKAAAANVTARELAIRQLRQETSRDQHASDVLQEKIDAADRREKEAEDKQAETAVEVKQAAIERQVLGGQLAAARAEAASLQKAKEALESSKQGLQQAVKREQVNKKRAESETCKTLQMKVADANNKKAQMHHALDNAVKLGRHMAKENKALRQAMMHTKEQLASILHRENDESLNMHKEIEKLHRELQQKDESLAMSAQMKAPAPAAGDAEDQGSDDAAAPVAEEDAGASQQDQANVLEQQALSQAAADDKGTMDGNVGDAPEGSDEEGAFEG